MAALKQYQDARQANDARLERALQLSDMERFMQFMALMRLGRLLHSAPKTHITLNG